MLLPSDGEVGARARVRAVPADRHFLSRVSGGSCVVGWVAVEKKDVAVAL